MADLCLSCHKRPPRLRGVCRSCYGCIRYGTRPDVMLPAQRPRHMSSTHVRDPEAVARRIEHTLARYPHLKRSE